MFLYRRNPMMGIEGFARDLAVARGYAEHRLYIRGVVEEIITRGSGHLGTPTSEVEKDLEKQVDSYKIEALRDFVLHVKSWRQLLNIK